MKSPFKFLDSYTKDDRDIFFGRDREIEELYQKVFDSKLLLVYGVSGTGKSSLIHCGLANKFQETDWLPLVIRRGSSIIESMASAISTASITPQTKKLSTPSDFKKGIRSLYLDHYKPVFFIFDQFEELFIFGDRKERIQFIQIVKSLVDSDLQCRLIFIMREEYMASVTEFEKYIPTFFSNRVRIEKMSHANAIEAIIEPSKVFKISVEDRFGEALLEKLSPGSTDVELTYLQVFLDKVFRLAASEKGTESDTKNLSFTLAILNKTGNVSDLLGSFLDEQIALLDDPDNGLAVLKSFVSTKGTKTQKSSEEVAEYSKTLGRPISVVVLNELLQNYVNLRILCDKDQNKNYELRHDALATKIYEKITIVEKEILEIRQFIENAWNNYQKRDVLLSVGDLDYIAPYESRLYLPKELSEFIEISKNEITRTKRRRRTLASITAFALIIVLSGFTIWAITERKNALSEREISYQNYLKARANSFNYLSQKVAENDPTTALRLAEYAHSIDTVNPDIVENITRIYYDNNLYKIVAKIKDRIQSVAFSSDGNFILTGSDDSIARLWDLNGNELQKFIGHNGEITSVAFSPNGKSIITGSNDSTAILWDFKGNILKVFQGHADCVLSVAFSPDGKLILTGSDDKTARLWDLHGNNTQVFKGHEERIWAVAFSPDGKKILTGSFDHTTRLWDLHGNLLQIFKGHKDFILSIAFSPDGKSILTGSFDNTARLWDLRGHELSIFTGHSGGVTSVAFSPDGKSILTGSWDKKAMLWELRGNILQEFKGHQEVITSVAFSHDGKSILTGSYDKTARLWNIQGNQLHAFIGHKEDITSVAFSPAGKSILTGSNDNTAVLWDLQGNILKVFKGHNDGILSVAFSPDGNNILTGSYDKTARLWDQHGNVLKIFIGHKDEINAVAFSPDGKSILTGSYDNTARLWDLQGNVLKEFIGHTDGIYSVAFAPDGKKILTGSQDNTARIWEINENAFQVLKGHEEGINSVAFSPEGKSILTGSYDKTTRLWDLNGNLIQLFKGQESFIYSVAFSPDGKNILTGSQDNMATIWNLKAYVLQVFKEPDGFISSAVFSPDGKSILTGSWDKTARLWEIKKPIKEFLKGNNYQELSQELNIKYGIVE